MSKYFKIKSNINNYRSVDSKLMVGYYKFTYIDSEEAGGDYGDEGRITVTANNTGYAQKIMIDIINSWGNVKDIKISKISELPVGDFYLDKSTI